MLLFIYLLLTKEEFPTPRVVHIKSNSGIYYLMTRGINQQNIFSSFAD